MCVKFHIWSFLHLSKTRRIHAILSFTAWITGTVKLRYNVGLWSQTDHSTRPSVKKIVQPYENMNRIVIGNHNRLHQTNAITDVTVTRFDYLNSLSGFKDSERLVYYILQIFPI